MTVDKVKTTDCIPACNETSPSLMSSSDPESPTPAGGLKARETWTRKIDFLLACVGFSVGLGNVWRFPYLCYKNGGGAFLFPYFICVVIGGIPMFFLEVALGQFMSEGGIGAWKICPIFQGIGVASTVIVSLLNIYYNVILAWAFYYLFSSLTTVLPWSNCDNEWNTPQCVKSVFDLARDLLHSNGTAANETSDDGLAELARNLSLKHSDPVTEFWERKVLQISSGIDDVGTIKWDLALCLLLGWIVVYLCICKGIKSSGKVTKILVAMVMGNRSKRTIVGCLGNGNETEAY